MHLWYVKHKDACTSVCDLDAGLFGDIKAQRNSIGFLDLHTACTSFQAVVRNEHCLFKFFCCHQRSCSSGPYPDQNPGVGGQYFVINIFVTIFGSKKIKIIKIK